MKRLWIALHYLGRHDYPDDRFIITPRRAWQIAGIILEMAEIMQRL